MPLVTSEKIEEWLKEVEARPGSAPLIIEFIARRLQDLSQRNETLLAENIALQSGKRIEEYERRISYLEYLVDVLKRRVAGGALAGDVKEQASDAGASQSAPRNAYSLLAFNVQGNVLRIAIEDGIFANGLQLSKLSGNLSTAGEPLRLLFVPSGEELLFVFTSGRIAMLSVDSIASYAVGGEIELEQAPIPDEPRAGETLACLTPISKLALADYFIQTSRRGYLKKINASMAQSIFANHYIGSGIKQPPDKSFSLNLAVKDERLILVTRQGYLQCLEARTLPVTVDEALNLETGDHLVAALMAKPTQTFMAVTQAGKVIHFESDQIETAASFRVKGQALFSARRREMGARVIGAAVARQDDWGAALQQDGLLELYRVGDVLGAGTIPSDGDLLAFTTLAG